MSDTNASSMTKSSDEWLPLPDHIDFEPQGMRVQTLHSAACTLFAAVDYIFTTEDEVVTAEEVSHVVGFSRYYVSRMFQMFLHEAPRALIVRSRQERAAVKLRETRESITSIARKEGYANAESFSRAFRTVYGTTPRDFRKSDMDWRLPCPSGLHWHEKLEKLPILDDGIVEVEIALMPTQRLATYRHVGPYNDISRGWQRLAELLPNRPWERSSSRICSVYHDDWLRRTSDRQRCDLGFTVPRDLRLPSGVSELVLPRGLYVSTRRALTRAENPDVWVQMAGRWLPRRGTRPANIPAYAEHHGWPLHAEDVPRKVFLGLDSELPEPWKIGAEHGSRALL